MHNNAPYAYDASFSVLHDRELVGQLYGYDPDGDAITASVVSGPSHGRLDFNPDGTFSYIPNSHFVGLDSFTYEVSDAINQAQGTVWIEVWNRPPVTFPSGITLYEGEEVFIAVAGLAVDPDGDTCSFTLQNSEWSGSVTLGQGILHYRAPINWSGQETIRLLVSDGLDESEAVISIQVDRISPGAANDLYVIEVRSNHYPDGVVSMPASSGVLANDFAAGGRTLTASLVRAPSFASGGNFTLGSDGSFAYALAENFVGEDSFQYIASDGYGQTQVATVRLLITDGAQAVDNVFELSEANRDEHGWYLMRPEEGLLVNDYIPPDARIVSLELLPSGNPELFELVPQHDTQGNIVAAGMRIYAYHPAEVEDIEVRYRIIYEIADGSNIRIGESQADVFLRSNLDENELLLEGIKYTQYVLQVVSDYCREGLAEAMASATKIFVQEVYERAYLKPYEKAILTNIGETLAIKLWNYLASMIEQSPNNSAGSPLGFQYVLSPNENAEAVRDLRLAAKQIWNLYIDEQVNQIAEQLRTALQRLPELQNKRWEFNLEKPHYELVLMRTPGGLKDGQIVPPPLGTGIGLELKVRPVLVGRLHVQGKTMILVQRGVYGIRGFPSALAARGYTDIGHTWYVNNKFKELEVWHEITRNLLNRANQAQR